MPMLVIPFAGEEVVAVKLTIQFAVEEVQFLGGFETDTFHGCIVGGEDPRGRTCKLMLERRPDLTVKQLHVFIGRQTLTVRRVEHHQG